MFNSWIFYIIVYLFSSTLFNQSFKVTTKRIINDGVLTVLLQLISSIICIIFIPFFTIKYPSDYKVYIFLGIAIIFYTLNDRLGTTARKGMDASIYIILKQISIVFVIIFGFIFYKEKFVLNKFIGSFLIIFSNVLIFIRKFKFNKYILLGIIANISLSIALFLDVNYSNYFNLSFYVLLTFLLPAIIITIFEKVKVKNIIKEYKNSNKKILIITSISWAFMMISKLMAYKIGPVLEVASISSLTVIINVIVGYFFLKERNSIIKKIICAFLVIIGIILLEI